MVEALQAIPAAVGVVRALVGAGAFPEDDGHQVRTEAWTLADGDRVAMIFVAVGEACAVVAVHAEAVSGLLFASQGIYARDAILSDRSAVLESLPRVPATPGFLSMLRVFSEGPEPFLDAVDGLVRTMRLNQGTLRAPREECRPGRASWAGPVPEAWIDPRTGHSLGWTDHRLDDIGRYAAIPAAVPPQGNGSVVRHGPAGPATDPIPGWHARLVDLCRPCGLPREAWTQATYALMSAEGELAERRCRAADLQPAFIPTLPLIPEVLAAIDAGEPFEHLLAEAVNERLRLGEALRLDGERMRILRLCPGTPCGRQDGLQDLVRAAARFSSAAIPVVADHSAPSLEGPAEGPAAPGTRTSGLE